MRLEGFLDAINEDCLHGWAMDKSDPGSPVTVDFFCDGHPLGRTVADLYRSDLKAAGIGDGRHAFAFPIPDGVRGEVTASVNGNPLNNALRVPPLLRDYGLHARRVLSEHYLQGEGIEIGALDKPMWVPDGVLVRTVDRLSAAELQTHYGIAGARRVDYVSDAQTLAAIPDSSQDFVVANHVFEHMENPLLALENWLRVLRPRGIVFMAIPDKRYTFDKDRPSTPLTHILREYQAPQDAERNRRAHYEEWIRLVEHCGGDISQRLTFLMEVSRYAIHFHAWAAKDLLELFASATWLGFEVDCYKFNNPECLVVLRKILTKRGKLKNLIRLFRSS